jgi:hypothetical protein
MEIDRGWHAQFRCSKPNMAMRALAKQLQFILEVVQKKKSERLLRFRRRSSVRQYSCTRMRDSRISTIAYRHRTHRELHPVWHPRGSFRLEYPAYPQKEGISTVPHIEERRLDGAYAPLGIRISPLTRWRRACE